MRARRSANESISSEKQERREEKNVLIAEEANSIAREALSISRKNERWVITLLLLLRWPLSRAPRLAMLAAHLPPFDINIAVITS